jgi:O-antigen ligase
VIAVAAPCLLAFNLPPSSTFLNQALAIVGWGLALAAWCWAVDVPLAKMGWGMLALVAALGLIALSAMGSVVFGSLPASLGLPSMGLVLIAAFVACTAAALQSAGRGKELFNALCLGLLVAGLLSVAVSVTQVFFPDWTDSAWIASSGFVGRASGNMRQPNHLSSLLLWSVIATVWLLENRSLPYLAAQWLAALFVFGIVMSSSRTGIVGIAILFLWGAFDDRQSRHVRILLLTAPIVYAIFWCAMSVWAHESHQMFMGEVRMTADGDISSSRFAIWSNTLSLIAQHPLSGVGFGEFNFAWSLTPFPHRPVAFFDHTHNLLLQLTVELGIPLAVVIVGLLVTAFVQAFQAAFRRVGERMAWLGAAFMMVLMIALHSLLEYPLWYAYFLLPTAVAFGLCLGTGWRAEASAATTRSTGSGAFLRHALVAGSMAVGAAGIWSVIDYLRVVKIFESDTEESLSKRIDDGKRSWLFAHQAHYAAATTAARPSEAMDSFAVAAHNLLDTRLMMAWAKAYAEQGDLQRAEHLAARLREFKNEDSKPFFAACAEPQSSPPFQCVAPTRPMDYRDFLPKGNRR